MAQKQKSNRGRKPNAFDYKKTAEHCSKQLADTKKALVKAEKQLAKAQLTHQELLSEVARLDMLDRSLKAVNDKTQPPQNIKYVYTYPQWVWNPYTYNVPNNGQWTITTTPTWVGYNTPNLGGTAIGGNINNGSSGSLLTSNGDWQSPTVTCTLAQSNLNGGTFDMSTVNSVQTTTSSNEGSGITTFTNSGGLTLTGSNSSPSFVPAGDANCFVVDLTTHEPYEESARSEEMPEVTCDDLVTA